ncbi:DUF6232 family protein [Ideonella livida]|uniref:Uncharacterized protein n=1 Tax=Ideonella livida TaxID=2707176 RepID=A0A7C9PEW9_9BURK|nr:DUF6232 family protein [Ideonella livida]NDY89750.1 hypothetical protein [Ideonella livida]
MSELKFFEHNGVMVTNARLVVDGQTYAMANITSVRVSVVKPNRVPPIAVGALGLPGLYAPHLEMTVLFVLLAAVIWRLQKTWYTVAMTTNSGEVNAIRSHQRAFAEAVVGALNKAIVSRG